MSLIQPDILRDPSAQPVNFSSSSNHSNPFSIAHEPVWFSFPAQRSSTYRIAGKRILDIVIVLLSAPFTLPIILLCALALWLEGGKPFYRQKRLGKDADCFSMLKLRTMIQNADTVLQEHLSKDAALREEWDRYQKLRNDPRVTRLGRFLRTTSLDELPQLWNVLKGDMSLVGPRPMMPDQLPMYGSPSAYFALRPGITGLWQVSARNGKTFGYRNEVDANYESNLGVTSDLRIMLKTVAVMLRRTGC